jgi:hypothetical protein
VLIGKALPSLQCLTVGSVASRSFALSAPLGNWNDGTSITQCKKMYTFYFTVSLPSFRDQTNQRPLFFYHLIPTLMLFYYILLFKHIIFMNVCPKSKCSSWGITCLFTLNYNLHEVRTHKVDIYTYK